MTPGNQKIYASYKARIERRLDSVTDGKLPESVYAPARYVLGGGGKRLRSVLVLLASEAVGGDGRDALDAAAAMEILHNFTLVHDDVMDNAKVRRGRPTVHERWDANIAILSGDGMIAQAYSSLLKVRTDRLGEILRVFTNAFIEVCEGQGLDKEFETRRGVSVHDYFIMIGKKTGRIIAAAAEIGALAGNGTGKQVAALRKFGEELGLAFQVQDDLLDITGDTEKFGKMIGGDIVEGKKTYLLLKAIERTRGRDRDLLRSIGPGNGITRKKIDRIRTIYEREQVIGAAKREIERATRRAQRSLAPIAPGRAKEMLFWLSDQLLRRDS